MIYLKYLVTIITFINVLKSDENNYNYYEDEFEQNSLKHHLCAAHILNLVATKVYLNYHKY